MSHISELEDAAERASSAAAVEPADTSQAAAIAPIGHHKKKAAFLEAFKCCGTIRGASRASGISKSSHYRWLADADYQRAFDAAEVDAAGVLVEAARQRAIEGTRSYKFTPRGFPILHPVTREPYYETKMSDVLLIFLIKSLKPEQYGDRQHLTHAPSDWRAQLASQGIDPETAMEQLRRSIESN